MYCFHFNLDDSYVLKCKTP